MVYKKFLFDLKQICLNRSIPIISDNTMEFLESILIQHKPKYCLEIWWAIWYSSIFLSNTIKQWNWQLISFEISYPNYKEWLQNLKLSNTNNIISYNFDFKNVPLKEIINSSLNFVFIDWMKKEYLDYYISVSQFLDNNCIIIFDDIIKYKYKLNNLYSFLNKNQINFEILQLDDDDGVMMLVNK